MNCTHRLYLRVLSMGIVSLIVVQTATVGQSRTKFAIQVLEAKSGQNLIAQEIPPIKVRVMDRTGRAIAGANVLFVAPAEGPTGYFLRSCTRVFVHFVAVILPAGTQKSFHSGSRSLPWTIFVPPLSSFTT